MAFSTTCPVNGAHLTASKRVAAPRRAFVQVLDLSRLRHLVHDNVVLRMCTACALIPHRLETHPAIASIHSSTCLPVSAIACNPYLQPTRHCPMVPKLCRLRRSSLAKSKLSSACCTGAHFAAADTYKIPCAAASCRLHRVLWLEERKCSSMWTP